MSHETRVTPSRWIAAALVALAAASAPFAGADDTFRGAAEIRLGDTVHAAFPEGAPAPHAYTFLATEGTVVSAVVRAGRGEALTPTLRVARPGGASIRLDGRVRGTGRAGRVAAFRVPYSGLFTLEVGAAGGAGAYTLRTSGRLGRTAVGIHPDAPAGDASFRFDAPEGTRVSARVAPRGRTRGPRIELTGITTPGGIDLPVLSLQRGAAAEIAGVPLPESGRSELRWTNHGTAGDLRVVFRFAPPPAVPRTFRFGVSDGLDVSAIERGDPVLAPRADYVGSAACGRCHAETVATWSRTAHNSAVRAWNRAGLSGAAMANDADGNGADDFRDGLDLATTPAFAAYGAAAPKLSFAAGEAVPNRVRIGTVTYTVDRTMGGNGLWMQRFLTKVGRRYHVLPFQFDERTRTYAAYDAEDWYDPAHAPLLASADAAPQERSFEARCSGCHNTGETVGLDPATGHVATGYVELDIGCEQCHGPGAAHARMGDVAEILNPRRDYANGTAAGVARANETCSRCHTKGTSVDPLPGTSARAEFGYTAARGVPAAGDHPAEFAVTTRADADFWGRKAGGTSVASRGAPMQGHDIEVGAHAATQGDSPACFDCHDPHERRREHQVAISVERGARITTQAGDNSLCLACHAGRAGDPFAAVPIADVRAIQHGAAPASVARAVIDHMKDSGMPAREGTYDPKGTGVGRCQSCHMPMTPTAATPGTDAAGHVQGDLHSHRFQIVWPNASELHGVTNSCSACHPTAESDPVAPIIDQWAKKGAAADGRFHADTARGLADGSADPAREVAVRTADGFIRVHVRGESLEQPEIDRIARDAVARDAGVTCRTCHGTGPTGTFAAGGNPLRLPKPQLCGTCHNDEGLTLADFRARGVFVLRPQREMVDGTAGSAPPGIPSRVVGGHTEIESSCTTCHYGVVNGVAKHDFRPNVAACGQCHPGLTTFDRAEHADYDGDGAIEGIQGEVSGLLDRLKAALLTDARMRFAGGFFDYDGASDHALAGATDAQARSVFNWYAVTADGSRGVHNATRALQLLQRSYRELTGTDVPGATIR